MAMTRRSITLTAMAGIAALMPLTSFKPAPVLVWNASESVPVGLYYVQPAGALFVTTLVLAMPPEPLASSLVQAGYLRRGVPLLKRILAVPGQSVCRHELII
ncbi:MAG: S26 family signal peptidase, partial [Gammaproteobacteria bacterium]